MLSKMCQLSLESFVGTFAAAFRSGILMRITSSASSTSRCARCSSSVYRPILYSMFSRYARLNMRRPWADWSSPTRDSRDAFMRYRVYERRVNNRPRAVTRCGCARVGMCVCECVRVYEKERRGTVVKKCFPFAATRAMPSSRTSTASTLVDGVPPSPAGRY